MYAYTCHLFAGDPLNSLQRTTGNKLTHKEPQATNSLTRNHGELIHKEPRKTKSPAKNHRGQTNPQVTTEDKLTHKEPQRTNSLTRNHKGQTHSQEPTEDKLTHKEPQTVPLILRDAVRKDAPPRTLSRGPITATATAAHKPDPVICSPMYMATM
jgi:hypothetical protein